MVQPLDGSCRYLDDDRDPPVALPVERDWARGVLTAMVAASIIIGSGVGGALLLLDAVPPAGRAAAAPTVAPAVLPTAPTGVRPRPTTLQEQAGADRAAAQKLVGRWVPQLSAKAPGLVVGDITYDEARIWSEFRELRARYPDAALVRSGDYRSFTRPGHWVTVLARAFADADAVNEWCDRQGFAPGDCFAKRLSNTGGPRGNTVLRR